ncbi:MAG: ImmA/IrrE family metallo-endopeptidase [Actinobacteria bacterium]|nr:ImmA/IrrE family metallo-endopeptidase [Actinomycetota bacterium]
MVTRVVVAPDMLRWAVERAGWDADVAARRAPRMRAWIDGDVRPTLKQLEKFAHDTHTPFGLLFLPAPPREEVPIPDMRTFKNGAVSRPSADLLETIYTCQEHQSWYHEFADEHGYSPVAFVGSATSTTSAEQVADSIRQLLHFEVEDRSVFRNTREALRGLIDRIEALGVLVKINGVVGSNTHRKLRPLEFRGFALADDLAPLIFVNGADTKAAQNFTLIHELAHLWLGTSALSEASMTLEHGETAELWCNRVAAEVLMPLAVLRSDYSGTLDTAELERLATRYRVSTLVVLKRLHDAHFVSWDSFVELYNEELRRILALLGERETGAGGNYYFTQPLRLSRQFAKAVILSTREGSTTYRDAYHLLGTRKHATFETLAHELGVA